MPDSKDVVPAAPREYDPVLEAELDRLIYTHEHQLRGSLAPLPREAQAGYIVRALQEKADGHAPSPRHERLYNLEAMPLDVRYKTILERLQRGIPAPSQEPRPRRSGEPGFCNE